MKLTELVESLSARGIELIDAEAPVDPDVIVHVLGTQRRRPIELVGADVEHGRVVLYIADKLEPLDPDSVAGDFFVEDGD